MGRSLLSTHPVAKLWPENCHASWCSVSQCCTFRSRRGDAVSMMRLRRSDLPATPAWPAEPFLFCASPWLEPRLRGAGQQHQRPWLQQCMCWASFQEACVMLVPVQRPHKARKLLRTPVTFLIFMLTVLCKRICSSSSVFFTDCIPLSRYISTSC